MPDPAATPSPAPAPAPDAAALEALPLSAYIAARKGGPVPQGDGDDGGAPAPTSLLEAQTQGEEQPPVADPNAELPADTPQERAAKASRTRGTLQARVDELTRRNTDYQQAYTGIQARLEATQQELARLRVPGNGHGNGRAAPAPVDPEHHTQQLPDPEPTLDQYLQDGKSYEQWVKDSARWQSRNEITVALAAERHQAQQAAQAQRLQEQISGFPARAAAVRAAHPDFDTVVSANDQVQLSPVMSHVTLTSARGAEVAYWLGTHPEEANELAELTQQYPPQSYALVERHLVALLADARSPSGASPAAPSLTRAPAPITPVGGSHTPASVPLEALPLTDYIRKRREHFAQQQKNGRP